MAPGSGYKHLLHVALVVAMSTPVQTSSKRAFERSQDATRAPGLTTMNKKLLGANEGFFALETPLSPAGHYLSESFRVERQQVFYTGVINKFKTKSGLQKCLQFGVNLLS